MPNLLQIFAHEKFRLPSKDATNIFLSFPVLCRLECQMCVLSMCTRF